MLDAAGGNADEALYILKDRTDEPYCWWLNICPVRCCPLMVVLLLFLAGVLGGTHPGGRPGCRSVWVPVLPRPWGEEEAKAGLSQGLGRKIPRGGGGRRHHQTRLHPHHLRTGESWEKGVFPGHHGRGAVFCMTITRAGNRDQSVERTAKLWSIHLDPVHLPDLRQKWNFCPPGSTVSPSFSHCHKLMQISSPGLSSVRCSSPGPPRTVSLELPLNAAKWQPEICGGSTNYTEVTALTRSFFCSMYWPSNNGGHFPVIVNMGKFGETFPSCILLLSIFSASVRQHGLFQFCYSDYSFTPAGSFYLSV